MIMPKYTSLGRRIFIIVNYIVLMTCAVVCLIPLINVLAISFSSSAAATANVVKLWPVDFTTSSYEYVMKKAEFFKSYLVSFERIALGVPTNMILTILVAYPLSKTNSVFRARSVFSWYFMITILIGGGLIPWYMVIKATGVLNSIWALILPGAVPVFNVIILLNFFRGLPKEIEEAMFIDGAGHWLTLWKAYVPLSKPALATLILFCAVGHWNSWFDGIILMNRPENYPLQSYLQTITVKLTSEFVSSLTTDELRQLSEISDRTTRTAQIFLAVVPILAVYPFLQKYFTKGIVLGSVKG